MSVKPLEKWTVVELRAKLKEMGQPATGVKAELITRLQQAQAKAAEGNAEEAKVSLINSLWSHLFARHTQK